ncbi:EamA family transporter [Aeromicrobium endophyticum]|uniref:EamA family transporter n=1 Tax=Aeromicrobium endophyticum TaxID=2292704 RepID=A0A371P9Q0_9ACTN|nr:EamA family transporter [Aeromicrobium endophyticum]REK72216.1 EamA family transporter [Aeromicrobium endophyticum]
MGDGRPEVQGRRDHAARGSYAAGRRASRRGTPHPRAVPLSRQDSGAGWTLAATSALAFALTGPLAKAIQQSGWSVPATVSARCLLSVLVLLPFVARGHPGQVTRLARQWRHVGSYGAVAIGGTQLCFFAAIQHVPVGVALLIEYLAPVLILLLGWVRGTSAFSVVTLAGALCCLAGLALVVDLGSGSTIDARGVAWALAAAVCLAFYFVRSSTVTVGLDPVAVVAGGMLVAGTMILVLAVVGALPWQVSSAPALLADHRMPIAVPLAGLVLVCTVAAYVTGVMAARVLGARLASFAGMLEVVLAALVAWLLLDEGISCTQAVGAAAILTGVATVRWREERAVDLTAGRPGQ